MAQFEAKRLDESKINSGNRYNVGDAVSEEAINAPIEGVLYAQNFLDAAMEKSQVALDGFHELKEKQSKQDKKIEENSQHVKVLYNIVKQKEFIDVAKVEQAFTSRETANGENIVDGQFAVVKEIKGATVVDESTGTLKHAFFSGIKSTGRNLIPKSSPGGTKTIDGVTFTDNGDGSITVNGTATANALYVVQAYSVKANQDYFISGCPSGGSDGTYYLEPVGFYWDIGSGYRFSNNADYTGIVRIVIKSGYTANNLVFKPMLNYGTNALSSFEPYTEEIYQLPQTLELGEFDSFNPQTGELVRATKEIVITGEEPRWHLSDAGTNLARFGHDGLASDAVGGSYRISNKDVFGVTQIEVYLSGWVDIYDKRYKSVEEWTTYLKSLNAAGTPLRIAYKLETPTTETIANVPKSYKVHNHGSETVNQGETDNSKYGAMCTITNEYMIIL